MRSVCDLPQKNPNVAKGNSDLIHAPKLYSITHNSQKERNDKKYSQGRGSLVRSLNKGKWIEFYFSKDSSSDEGHVVFSKGIDSTAVDGSALWPTHRISQPSIKYSTYSWLDCSQSRRNSIQQIH